ncbi:MAG: NYN domain-containing protein [Chloroflexaceae bacterium]|nr:NYN domain-containing protein [Chloroflexaceae bacterium]
MSQEQNQHDVAVFIDFENVYVSVRDKLDANPNFESIMDRCNDLGRVVIARAYADWYRYPRITSALYANGIEPIYVPTYYYDKEMGRTGRAIKNSVDMNLCIDAMKSLFMHTNIRKFALVTGDRDFIPLVNSIRQQGKDVIVIGIGGAASTHLAQSADEFIFYEQLIGKTPPIAAASRRTARSPEPATLDEEKAEQPAEVDIYDMLVQAVHLVRERGYVSTLGSLKLVMKELMGGDFKESRYKDPKGRSFSKFKDFVIEAERRGKVQIFTSGTVSEVFLPGEDAQKLSQFAEALKEEPAEDEFDTSLATVNGRQDSPPSDIPSPSTSSSSSSRRRRRRQARNKNLTNEEARVEGSEKDQQPQQDAVVDEYIDDQMGDPELQLANMGAYDEVPREIRTDDEALDDESPPNELVDLLSPYHDEDVPDAGFESSDHDEIVSDSVAVIADHAIDESSFDDLVSSGLLGSVERDDEQLRREWERAEALLVEDHFQNLMNLDEAIALAPMMGQEPEPDSDSMETTAPEVGATEELPHASASDMNVGAPEPSTDTASEPQQENIEVALVSEDAALPGAVEPAADTLPTTDPEPPAQPEDEIVFTYNEWTIFRQMMSVFTVPVAFTQILEALRELRNQQVLTRTNEQLRSLIKQAINDGVLERSGRGNRIYYRLKDEDAA